MELLDSCTLSDEDKQIVKMYYLQNKSIGCYIADILGYSESNIKKRHNKILNKLSKLI
jgi:DNA-directed RNA polymerase specialized sigma subunit